MAKMQEVLMAAIRERITKRDLTAVEHWDFGNIGTVYAIPAGSLRTAFKVAVAFQSGYCTISILRPGAASNPPADRARTFHHLDYDNAARLEAMLRAIDNEPTT